MNAVKWVLIDSTKGVTTQDGSKLSPAVLNQIAEAVQDQVNHEFAAEWGAQATIRVGTADNIQPGEWAYGFVGSLPDAPGASAYHDINNKGVPFALCAVTTCGSLLGPNGVSVDGPYDYMSSAKLAGAVAPAAPLKTAPGHGGNYQIVSKWGGEKQVFAAANHILGTRRKGADPNWSSRAAKRLREIQRMDQVASQSA